jgi:uncharacterized membrane protein
MFDVPIHKFLVHFPIALTVIALIYDSWAVYAKKPELHRTGYGLTLWAAVAGLAAVGTGLQLAEMVHLDKGAVTGHAGFGLGAVWRDCGTRHTLARTRTRTKDTGSDGWCWRSVRPHWL